MNFLALSQAPPALAIITAMRKPVSSDPASSPATAFGPRVKPRINGTSSTSTPGSIIDFSARLVAMSTQAT